jgi:hypothetical protein
MARQVAKFGVGLAAVAAGAMALWIRQQLKAVDLIGKVSDKLGITTEKLIAYRHAASLAGVEARTFDMALQRMLRRLAEAAKGTGEAKDALKELGLDPVILSAGGAGTALEAVVEALSQVRNQSDRVRLAFKLFDSEGVAMVNLAKRGTEGLRDAMQEAVRFGLVLSRLDVLRVEQVNDAITRMKASLTGLARTATIAMSAFMTVVANRLTETFANFRGKLTTDILPAVGEFAVKALNFMDLFFAGMKAGVLEMVSDVHAAAISIQEALAGMGMAPDVSGRVRKRGAALSKAATMARIAEDVKASGNVPLWGTQLEHAMDAVVNAAQSSLAQAAADRFKAFFEPLTAIMRAPLLNMQRFLTAPFEFMRGTLKAGAAAPSAPQAAMRGAPTQFAQVDLSRTFIPGLSGGSKKQQTVFDEKVWKEQVIANKHLAEMKRWSQVAMVGP